MALLLFDGVELLDFAGPLEVFSVADKLRNHELLRVITVSPAGEAISAANGLTIEVDRACAEVERANYLIVPGGVGTRKLVNSSESIDWIRRIAGDAAGIMSVCSGALLLGKAGLLDGLEVTTHHAVFDELSAVAPEAKIIRGVRYTDNGKIITSAGISAGIDASLYLVEKLFGAELATATSDHMEYERSG